MSVGSDRVELIVYRASNHSVTEGCFLCFNEAADFSDGTSKGDCAVKAQAGWLQAQQK